MPFESTTPFIRRGTFRDPVFEESMSVRVEVFVNEQGVPAENERDEYDEDSIHWVTYASIPSVSSNSNHDRHAVDGISPENELSQNRTPVGTIRLIPPTVSKKSYVLLGRLAVLKPFRKLGLARLLVEEALRYAASEGSAGGFDLPGEGIKWDGKCYVHAQTNVQGWWANNGFYRDDDAGEWDEEGIMHVGMWKDIALERRRSIINL
ncbi:hypothetical protein TWF225_008189 [Orbilia oligospora]|uniref:Uncharacterized protein n=1 Tax=Orbilia oligospora TaxID=2813651 RepID=A0A7C8PYD0_ORBOL|nr:hypothetical protein TWF751_000106 [Orbilia oligospora]KAF3194006.1 hypothetical protein TWF225_008189 [Orbilia oligospora]KAF3246443.1 hypothetical protein TWF128_008907 [Orbilia oligospora]KAF3268903.1 hypothetical protein TWF217_010191 [Orbilia oligospora]KAF3292806.1 hypothetical protein TWF132_005175 [Orbilia oligospora]